MSGLSNPAPWLIDWVKNLFGTGDSKVTPETMLRIAAVWYGINKICGGLLQMPIDVKWRLEQGADDYKTHPWWAPLRGKVNSYQTIDIFKQQLGGHSIAWGNGRAAIVRPPFPELIPLMPDRTISFLVRGEKYHVTYPDAHDRLWNFETALSDNEELKDEMRSNPRDCVVLHDREVIHIQGFGYDGITGKGIYDVARDSLGIGLQANQYTNKQLKRGFAGQVMLTAPVGVFTQQKDAEEFLAAFRKTHELSQDGESIGLLRQGITAQVLQATNRDSQMVERLKFDRQDVMLWLGIESMPGDDSPRGGYNGLQELKQAFLDNTMGPWITKWEMQLNTKLRTESEIRLDKAYFKFNTATILRMDLKSTMETLGNAIIHTIMSPDEARDKLDMKPRADGLGGRYVNPAIATDKEPEQDDDEAETKKLASKRAAAAIESHLLSVESARIEAACKAENFCDTVDKFYARWRTTISEAILNLGHDPTDAVERAASRQEKVKSIAGTVHTKDELTLAIRAETESWATGLITT